MMDRYPDEHLFETVVDESKLHSHESEYAVIGSMIKQPELVDDLSGQLVVSDFHHPACAELFELLVAMHSQGRAIDIVTLYEARSHLADGQNVLQVAAKLADNTPSTANAGAYARTVKQRSVARRVIAAAQVMSQRLMDGESLDEVLSQGQQAWLALEAEGTDSRKKYRFIRDVLPEAVDGIDRRFNRQVSLGYDTGLPSLDEFIPGICLATWWWSPASPAVGRPPWASDWPSGWRCTAVTSRWSSAWR